MAGVNPIVGQTVSAVSRGLFGIVRAVCASHADFATLGAMPSVSAAVLKSGCVAVARACSAGALDDQQFNGKWDITVSGDPRAKAWWLEVAGAGTENVKGKFVGAPGGQLDDIPKISTFDGELRFSFQRKYQRDQKGLQKG